MKFAVPLVKNILAPWGITAAASAIDAGTQKKMHGSETKVLMILIEEMNDIIKIVQALQDSNISLKAATKTIKSKTKEQKGIFKYVIRYSRSKFVRKFINRKKNCKSWL